MGIFDALTGNASAKAAKQNAALIGQGLTAGSNALGVGATNAIDALGTRGAGDALSALGQGYDRARGDLGMASTAVQGLLGQAGALYQGLAANGQAASDTRSDALGLNGPDGTARAKAAFQSSLGYNAGLDSGLDSVMRSAAARGMLGSGNASQDLFNYAADYQNRQAGSYLDRLNTVSGDLTTGLAGQANALGGQASAMQGYGTALGALGVGQGQNSASLFGKAADVQTGLGQNVANLWGNATGQLVQNNNNRAQAENQASANLLGLGQNALGGIFNFASGGGTLSKLANVFS